MGAYRQAFQQLAPGAKISFSGLESYETVHWKSTTVEKPSKETVEALVAELQPAWDQWEADRVASYPSVEEQLDLLWHTVAGGQAIVPGCAWFERIHQVKISTPKPE